MVASKTTIKHRTRSKTNPQVIEAVRLGLKQKAWHSIAQAVSNSTKHYSSVNLKEIDRQTKLGDIVIVIGKVLSSGSITKKIRICALGISALAKDKLSESKSEFASIADEIKKNPKAEGIKLIR